MRQTAMSPAKQVTIDHAEKLAEALDRFVKLENSISADVYTAHKNRGDGASDFMREDDSDMRGDLRKAFAIARDAIATYRASRAPPAIGPERDAE